MIFYNLTMLFFALNLSTNHTFDETGIARIDYRDYTSRYDGWFTPVYNGKGVIVLWKNYYMIEAVEHELKHLKAWRTNKSCYVENIRHGDCFEKQKVRIN